MQAFYWYMYLTSIQTVEGYLHGRVVQLMDVPGRIHYRVIHPSDDLIHDYGSMGIGFIEHITFIVSPP